MSTFGKVRALVQLVTSGELSRNVKTLAGATLHQADATCPCCGFVGKFRSFGSPIRPGAMCPKCFSMERQRLFALAVEREFISFAGKKVLHIAPEYAAKLIINNNAPAKYVGSSYPPSADCELSLDIENMDLEDGVFDTVLCSHVLEHVDDRKALAEINRILAAGGELIAMVPIIEGWTTTYEDASKTSEHERRIHFGQDDHVRYYGADFRDRIVTAGFSLREFVADGADTIKYSLLRGERIFVGTKH